MEKGSFVREFVAGNVGGLSGILLVYPLDTAKIRLQVNPAYGSMSNVFKEMISRDGYTALYRGLPSPAVGFGITFAVCFSSYGFGCRTIADLKNIERSQLSLADLAMAGVYTGFAQSPFRQVMERVKSVMQVRELQCAKNMAVSSMSSVGAEGMGAAGVAAAGVLGGAGSSGKAAYSWTGQCAVELVREEGWRRGLFRGYSSVLLREVPQFAVYYPTYEYSKKKYMQYLSEYPKMAQLMAGGTAGIVQWMPPIYYADVIKSKMQTAAPGQYSGLWDCARKIWNEPGGGFRAYHRGFGTALLRAFPLHATVFLGYEAVMGMSKDI